MVVGTLCLVQKGQTSGCSTAVECSQTMVDGDIVLWFKKFKSVNAVRSGIVVYGGGDIVFGAKRSNQWMQ